MHGQVKSSLVSATVKFPPRLREEALDLVKEGYFKNFSEVAVSGIRRIVQEYHLSNAAREARQIRDRIWTEFLEKAGDDPGKAADLFNKELDMIAKRKIYRNAKYKLR